MVKETNSYLLFYSFSSYAMRSSCVYMKELDHCPSWGGGSFVGPILK